MQIKSVSYGRTRKVGQADSESIDCRADINSEDGAEATLSYLQGWASEKLQVRETVARLNSRKNELQSQVYALERDVEQAKAKGAKVKEFLEKMGITNVDDIPF